MAKISIYLPDELRDRLAKLPGVNVSRVAAEAIDREIKARSLDGTDMAAAVKRLRASRATTSESDRQRGYRFGGQWAREYASWEELTTVVGLNEEETDGKTLASYLGSQDFDSGFVLNGFGVANVLAISRRHVEGFINACRDIHAAVEAAQDE